MFNIPFGDDPQKDIGRAVILYPLLFGQQLGYIFGHELGHHVAGHTIEEENSFWKEFDSDPSSAYKFGDLKSQAYEIQADAYAAQTLLTALFETEVGDNSLKLLGRLSSDPERGELLIGIFITTVCAVLFALPNSRFEESDSSRSHPLKAARLNNMISRIKEYTQNKQPKLVDWLTLEKFQVFTEAIRSSIPPMSDSWTAETEYLLSEIGAKYYKSLIEEVINIEHRPNPFRWIAISDGVEGSPVISHEL